MWNAFSVGKQITWSKSFSFFSFIVFLHVQVSVLSHLYPLGHVPNCCILCKCNNNNRLLGSKISCLEKKIKWDDTTVYWKQLVVFNVWYLSISHFNYLKNWSKKIRKKIRDTVLVVHRVHLKMCFVVSCCVVSQDGTQISKNMLSGVVTKGFELLFGANDRKMKKLTK